MRTLLLMLAVLALVACSGRAPDATAPAPSPTPLATPEVVAPDLTPAASPTPAPQPQVPTATPTPAADPLLASRELADTPDALAEQLVTAERAVRDEAVTGPALEDAAFVQQAAYRLLAERTEWQGVVAEQMPEELARTFERNLAAANELRALTTPQEQLPPWRIVEPAPAPELVAYYQEAEAASGAPWPYIAAIHLVETRMGRIRGTSTAGAQGPMQFMPATWDHWGQGDVNDNRDAILAAGRYLRDHGAPDDMARALYAYNRSDRYVQAVTAYAQVMADDPQAYRGYHAWQVYYRTTDGDVLLPVGYEGPD